MIRRTKILLLFLLAPALSAAETRYSGEFDYRNFESSHSYFSGRAETQVEHLCKTGEHASTQDLEQCEHREFEHANAQLDVQLKAMSSLVERSDQFLKKYGGKPSSAPYFSTAQDAWLKYRDNECYTETYMMGEAAERYIHFWDCMATMTNNRAKELKQVLKDWNTP